MDNFSFIVYKANKDDINDIHNIILPYIQKEILLNRTLNQILEDIDTTWVCKHNNIIIGTVSLVQFENNLWEVRALAVKNEYHGKKVGSLLITKIIEHLKKLQINDAILFALTYTPDFFLYNGFNLSKKENFPQKIYEVCQFCPKQNNCHEIAVEKKI